MKFIRIVGVAGVAAVLFLGAFGAGPALAAAPNVVINSPGSDQAYDSYPTISGSITEDGAQPEVTSASVAISSDDGFSSENATINYPGGQGFSGSGASVSFSWKPTPKYNGKYTVTVQGAGRSGGFGGNNIQSNIVTRSFRLVVPPATATGVAAGMDDNAQVTITWKANAEPDMAGYEVFRSYAGGNASSIGKIAPSSKPTFHDDLTGKPQGAYKYQVLSYRKARTCASSTSDDACTQTIPALARSSYSAAVTVRGTGATTTTSTTIKKGGGSGGGGNNTGGGGNNTGGGGNNTGGGSTSGGGKGSTGGTNSGKTAPRNTGGFAPGGNVDLSQFGGLLGGNGKTTRNGTPIDEGTYDGELPYDASEKPVNSGKNDDSLISLGGADIPAPNKDWVKFIGAGSLMTALLVHVLWFKQQVDAFPLETID